MIYGVGCDIVEIGRIETALNRTPKLAERILTAVELESYNASKHPIQFLAKRFAAKEAVVKALGTGVAQGISWQQIQINHEPNGRPWVQLTGAALEHANRCEISSWHLSCSDEQHYAMAFATAEST